MSFKNVSDQKKIKKAESTISVLSARKLCCYTSHSSALFSATVASFRTLFTMLHVVPCTFIATGLAKVCTEAADLLGCLSTHAHYLSGCITDSRTFHVQLNTPCHHLHVILMQAGRSTMVANSGTTQTSFNITLILMIISWHDKRFIGLRMEKS